MRTNTDTNTHTHATHTRLSHLCKEVLVLLVEQGLVYNPLARNVIMDDIQCCSSSARSAKGRGGDAQGWN
eukprot:925187-Pelagomonas_calceolata.AAC.4